MSDIGADLRLLLIADQVVFGLVGPRIYPKILPQNPTLPAITYQRVGGTEMVPHDGRLGFRQVSIQVDCWASTHDGAEELRDAVRAALNGWSEGFGLGQVQAVILTSGDREFYEDDTKLHRVSEDYVLAKQEVA